MKRSLIPVLLLILLSGCLLFPLNDVPDADDVFYLADRDGNPFTRFATGEDFLMKFNLVNTTEDTLDYAFTGPKISFTIYQGLTRIAGSTDGLAFAHVMIYTKLAPGDTLKSMWLAPTPPIQSTKINLAPGEYRAVAAFPAIEELQTDTIPDIYFTITR